MISYRNTPLIVIVILLMIPSLKTATIGSTVTGDISTTDVNGATVTGVDETTGTDGSTATEGVTELPPAESTTTLSVADATIIVRLMDTLKADFEEGKPLNTKFKTSVAYYTNVYCSTDTNCDVLTETEPTVAPTIPEGTTISYTSLAPDATEDATATTTPSPDVTAGTGTTQAAATDADPDTTEAGVTDADPDSTEAVAITTTEAAAITTTAEADVMTTTAEADVMTTTAEADVMTTTAEAAVMTTTAEADVMTTTAEAAVMTTTAEADVMTTTAEADVMTTTAEADVMTTTAEADVMTTTTPSITSLMDAGKWSFRKLLQTNATTITAEDIIIEENVQDGVDLDVSFWVSSGGVGGVPLLPADQVEGAMKQYQSEISEDIGKEMIVDIPDPSPPDDSLEGWAIALITIACLAVVAVIIGGIIYYVRGKSDSGSDEPWDTPEPSGKNYSFGQITPAANTRIENVYDNATFDTSSDLDEDNSFKVIKTSL